MNTLLIGGTGYIGSAVLENLISRDHTVTALVRSEQSAAKVTAAGARAVIGDATDEDWLVAQLADADAAIQTATTGDARSAVFDQAIASAVVRAYAGTSKPHLHTGGLWIWGSGSDLTEDHPFDPPQIVAWRRSVESMLVNSNVRATVIAPGIVYGHGGGILTMLTGGPRDEDGRLLLIGDGTQHWTTVHVEDLARLYVTVLERGEGLGYLMGVSGQNPTVREMGEAVAGEAGVAPESADATRARFGVQFADALLLDQQAAGAKARSLGWTPTAASLLTELRNGYGD